MEMDSSALLKLYEHHRKKEVEREERERRGHSEHDGDLNDAIEMRIVEGLVRARLDGRKPKFAVGSKIRCKTRAQPEPRFDPFAGTRGDIFPQQIIKVSNFAYEPNEGWFYASESGSDSFFYPESHFERTR